MKEINVTEILDVESDGFDNCPVMEAVYILIGILQNNPESSPILDMDAADAVTYLERVVNEKEARILETRRIEQGSEGAAIDRALDSDR